MDEIRQVDAIPTPADFLLALLVTVLLAVGIVLLMSYHDPSDHRRLAVTSPQRLISQSDIDTVFP